MASSSRSLFALAATGALAAALYFYFDFKTTNSAAPSGAAATDGTFDQAKSFETFASYIGTPPKEGPRRFAVGLNSCVDLIVPALEVFKALGAEGFVEGKDHDAIGSLKDLQETFRHFFEKGGAGERFVSNGDLFKSIVTASRGVKAARNFVGGNAALMGLTIKNKVKHLPQGEEVSVLMGGGYGPELKDMLSSHMILPEQAELEVDDYHVILEYPSGAEWGGVKAPRANRFIISHDITNAQMQTLELFQPALESFLPEAVVLSGLHMLEGENPEFRSKRLSDFVEMLKKIPKHIPIHLELASMALEPYVKEIAEKVLQYVDSIGLNEQELELVANSADGPHKEVTTRGSVADTAKVSDSLYWLLQTYSGPSSRLSRIHFHSLTFHLIAHVEGAWNNTDRAVAAGSWACTTRACQSEDLQLDQVTLRFPTSFQVSTSTSSGGKLSISSTEASIGWARGGIAFNLSPVYVCNSPGSTVGLGDAISATGLFYSVLNKKKATNSA